MWKNSLIEIGSRASKKAALASTDKLQKKVITDVHLSRACPRNSTGLLFSAQANALVDSRKEYLTQLQSSTLHSSLSTSTPAVRSIDERDALLQSVETFPFLYAQEAFCVLMKAGEVQSALQLTTLWKYQKLKSTRLARKKVKRELLNTICTLKELKDASTLKALIDVLCAALREQQLAHKSALQALSLTYSEAGSPLVQYRLFAPLGVVATTQVLVCAAETACRFRDGEGISMLEKLVILDKCADINITTVGTACLSYRLYRLLELWTVEKKIDANFAKQVCPGLSSKLVHPSHYSILDILSLTAKEARYIQKNWISCGFFRPDCSQRQQPSKWSSILNQVFISSKTLQTVEANCLLLSLIGAPAKHTATGDCRSFDTARTSILRLLGNSQPSVRRHAAMSLLKKRQLLRALQISPFATAYAYLQSFHSKAAVDPKLCKICKALLFRLCRAGRYMDAARVTWNHLTVECPATAAFFKKNVRAVDLAVAAVSQAMREASTKRYGQSWMGYRSLALLRAAASDSHHVTVMHCVPICVGALGCGVPFAAVNEALSHIFGDDVAQKTWALNLVRLCSDTEVTTTKVKVNRCGIATEIASFLAQMCGDQGDQQGKAVLQTPSRSKQLALWTTLTEQHSNPRLNSLMTAVFLDRATRNSILECTWCRHQAQSRGVSPQKEHASEKYFSDIWNWEVAASMASNCSSGESFTSFLRCLKHRKPHGVSSACSSVDNVTALLCSEMDAYIPSPGSSGGQSDIFCITAIKREI
ncbi:hypothetical protein JKF63_05545 [Porcisia hertigi]|uniref:Uncharacterized protein n=1 Tax=Porcisia hertigi TaxID=2761500 RepID=A0A836LAX4_9TRYP|nr:hypothetical protein JKF63_05545 [Porcisia hertigi]